MYVRPCGTNAGSKLTGLQMYTGIHPFDGLRLSDFRLKYGVRAGNWPPRPLAYKCRNGTGILDPSWNLMERCRMIEYKQHPTAAQVVDVPNGINL
jgi:hypothetical protein